MSALDELFYITLGWDWVLQYASLIVIIAAALLLILLITFIIVAVRHSKNKKRFKKMQAQIDNSGTAEVQDSGELRAEIRAEMEPIIREQVEREYRNKQPVGNEQAEQQIAALNDTIREKDARIDELGLALSQANTAHSNNNTELYRTINDLNQSNKNLQNDVNILKAENAQLKAQAAQPKASRPAAKAEPVAQAAPQRAKKTAPVKEPEPVYDDDDDDDEYDNEYGDETSAVKVTLKYDRIKMNWVIYRSDTNRAYRRIATKQEGLIVAKDLARRLHAQLVVHKKDGKFQKI